MGGDRSGYLNETVMETCADVEPIIAECSFRAAITKLSYSDPKFIRTDICDLSRSLTSLTLSFWGSGIEPDKGDREGHMDPETAIL